MEAKSNHNKSPVVAYLDIETTGLSPCYHDITVIGIYQHNGSEGKFIQLYGETVNRENLKAALEGISTIYTYNGSRFDLPFIKDFLGIDIENEFEIQHCDLMYKCWENNLKGGFKSVERQLGIDRETAGVDGAYAVYLWNQYLECYDLDALELLLKYNRDDVINLKTVKDKLNVP
jgi:uncharacterized protein YprB with RNaseH-like and TPR domain